MFEIVTAAKPALSASADGAGAVWRWLMPAVEMAALATGNWPLSRDPARPGWTCLPRVATRTPRLSAGSVGAAREFTAAILGRWGLADRSDDVVVVVSELLTNALRHAVSAADEPRSRCPVRLALLQPGPCVLCAVSDPSPATPVLREPGWFEERGRGLHVVDALSDQWGWTAPGPAGKVVWAMISAARPMVYHS